MAQLTVNNIGQAFPMTSNWKANVTLTQIYLTCEPSWLGSYGVARNPKTGETKEIGEADVIQFGMSIWSQCCTHMAR
jgi:hypothetical protein